MAAPAPAPRTVAAGPGYYRSPWYFSRILLFIAAIMFFLAAISFGGSNILNAVPWQWMAAGFCAWALSWAVP